MSAPITERQAKATYELVMHYFREISQIPRGSGKEQKIADYLVNFAKERGFTYTRSTATVDGKQTHDVVIEKPGTAGYENLDAVILQAHTDMVCQKVKDSAHNFDADPIEIIERDGKMRANGTTLGADDGIGVACILALLKSTEIAHPPIKALFTSDEEDGMTGAMAVTKELVNANRLINIDTETEGTLYYGCAGGLDAVFRLPYTLEPVPDGYELIQIEMSGLLGGHSGVEIHKKHANAHKLMARALRAAFDAYPAMLITFIGGDKRNVITREASALIAVEKNNKDKVIELIKNQEDTFLHEYEGIENPKTFRLTAESAKAKPGNSPLQALSHGSRDKFLALILVIPNDIQAMHGKVDNLVETSCNLGIIRQETDHFYLCSLIRSFFRTKKLYVLEQMRQLAALSGAAFSFAGDYPDWEPNPDSELIARFKRAYESAFPGAGEQGLPRVESIHAGLECGYFTENFPGMDMIACGPTITGAHTPEETLDVESTEKVVALLLTVLAQMDSAPERLDKVAAFKNEASEPEHICRCIR